MKTKKLEVIKFIEKYKTSDVYELCDKMNADERFTDIGTLRSFYRYLRKNKFIVITNN